MREERLRPSVRPTSGMSRKRGAGGVGRLMDTCWVVDDRIGEESTPREAERTGGRPESCICRRRVGRVARVLIRASWDRYRIKTSGCGPRCFGRGGGWIRAGASTALSKVAGARTPFYGPERRTPTSPARQSKPPRCTGYRAQGPGRFSLRLEGGRARSTDDCTPRGADGRGARNTARRGPFSWIRAELS